MQLLTQLQHLFAPFLEDESLPAGEVRRRLFIVVAALLALPLLALFTYLEIVAGAAVLAVFMAASTVLMAVNVWWARQPVFTLTGPRITLAMMCLIILVELFHQQTMATLLWGAAIPVAAVFVFGRREGLAWSLAMMLCVVAILFDPGALGLENLDGALLDFAWSYTVVLAFAFGYETLQGRAQRNVEQRARDLEQERSRFRDFAEVASDWLFELDDQLRFTYVSEKWSQSLGLPDGALLGFPVTVVRDSVIDQQALESQDIGAVMMERNPFRDLRFSIAIRKRVFHISASANPMFDTNGRFLGYRGTATDVTDMENSQRLVRHRETELAQAQKMEAIGQLTSGVAHDFNNLLTVINGNLELLEIKLTQQGLSTTHIAAARSAGSRAAELTSKLLAFARRQSLAPEPVDVSALVAGLEDLLKRTLGETIEVGLDLPEDLWPCHVDAGQLENALLNLTINARDAMPEGGVLSIVCANRELNAQAVPPLAAGDYVQLSVSDDGVGISEDQLEHVFEPFFSTKAQGQGSGLGLSMVYGFASQSGRRAVIDSRIGEGTTVSVYLPRYEGELEPLPRDVEPAVELTPKRVLLVEDEGDVLELVATMLRSLGHEVRSSNTAENAIAELCAWQPDVLITDVVLRRGMSGLQLAQEASDRSPDVRVLLMSGYPESAISADGSLDRRWLLLKKPFGVDALKKTMASLYG